MNRKKSLIALLIVLFLALLGIFTWYAIADIKREQEGLQTWGSMTDYLTVTLIAALILAIIATAVRLQKFIDKSNSNVIHFPPMAMEVCFSHGEMINYFNRPPIRPENDIFHKLWRALLPPAVKVLMTVVSLLCMSTLGLLLFFLYGLGADDRRLDRESSALTTGMVTSVERETSSTGSYYVIDYQYQPSNDRQRIGRSLAKESPWRKGDRVEIQYLVNQPGLSRVVGTKIIQKDMLFLAVVAVLLTMVLLPGILLYYLIRKRSLRRLVLEGNIVNAQIHSLRKGGKGTVFAKMIFYYREKKYRKSLIFPAMYNIYPQLDNRKNANLPVLVLAHPDLIPFCIQDDRNIYCAYTPYDKPSGGTGTLWQGQLRLPTIWKNRHSSLLRKQKVPESCELH